MISIRTLKVLSGCGVVAAFSMGTAVAAGGTEEGHSLTLTGEYRGVHDPSIIKEGDTYYVFATGAAFAPAPPGAEPSAPGDAPRPRPVPVGQLPIRCSKDLLAWTRCGQVFTAVPEWIKTASPKTQDLWAPDISFFAGTYHLYYAYSVFGKNTSGIALATNVTLDASDPRYKWVDQGLVLESKATDDFNAIDPNIILDKHGEPWMAFGSFWTGIKMRRLDAGSGKLSAKDTKVYPLAARAHPKQEGPQAEGPAASLPPDSQAVEAPFVLRHGKYFYLFVSWDLCCRGPKSTYREMVGRSKKVTGPYRDQDGRPMLEGGGTPLLKANASWAGPGGASLIDLGHDEDAIVFHAYDGATGRPAMQISTLGWNGGWPSARVLGDR